MAQRVSGTRAVALTALALAGGCTLISGGADLYTTEAAGAAGGTGGSGGTGATGGGGTGATGGGGGTGATGGGGSGPGCGNGEEEGLEECDDGNLRSHDGCSSGCTLETPIWNQLTPTSPPPRRYGFALGYDEGEHVTVLFGGLFPSGTNGTLTDETWVYDRGANGWTEASPTSSPSARTAHRMAFSHANGVNRVVVFGGGETPLAVAGVDNTYEYSSTADNWAFVSNGNPSARLNHAMVWDSTNERIVLFGGYHTPTMFGDTHQYDGSWTDLNPTGTLPGTRFMHSMAFDSVRGQIVLFGGWDDNDKSGQTFELDVVNNTWSQASPGDSPSARVHPHMAYDLLREVVVLFGGDGNTDTWEYNGTTWAKITTTTEPPSSGEMVYDTLHRRVIFLADPETGTFSQTWEYRATSAWPDELCDFAADEDSDGLENCADPDCEGLPCDGGTCSGGTCQ